MRHLRQPNGWSCLATSFAMVTDTTVEQVWEYTGHDGSAIAFPTLPDPARRRAHTFYEMNHYALFRGYGVVPFEPKYDHVSLDCDDKSTVYLNPQLIDEMFAQANIVMVGKMASGSSHATVWCYQDQAIFDPNGNVYSRRSYPMNIEALLLCLPLKKPLWLSSTHDTTLPTTS